METIEVKEFYGKKPVISKLLKDLGLPSSGYTMRMEAHKAERMLHVYLKLKEGEWRLIRSYAFCNFSGELGPKRREGDLQIPEGIYKVAVFNPQSKFYLSMGLDYPNERDMLLADPKTPGSDIYIHGGCETVGCIPITDENMAELYLLAKSAAPDIEVVILPFEPSVQNKIKYYAEFPQWREFWAKLFEDVQGVRANS